MKKKRWAMVFAAEALLCAALTVLLRRRREVSHD